MTSRLYYGTRNTTLLGPICYVIEVIDVYKSHTQGEYEMCRIEYVHYFGN